MLDYLIVNGKYPDYSAGSLIKGNVGVKDGKICYLGPDSPEAETVIDATDRVVSPGFIDLHMHEDNFNEGKKFVIGNMMLKQGVTTCVGGNCGTLFQTVSEFREGIEELGGSPVNYIMLSGYNHYRHDVLGVGGFDQTTWEQRKFIREQQLKDLEAGAFGISFGIEYDPFITEQEVLEDIALSNDPDLLVAAHYRNDCIGNIDSIYEMVDIQSRIDKRFQISHLSSCSALGMMDESLELINDYMAKDPRLNYDTYPYNAFATFLGSTVFDDGCLEAWHKDYKDLLLTGEPYPYQFATEETFRDARVKNPDMMVVAFVMNEDEIAKAIANPNGMVASDGILNNGNGHPRAAGTFPRVLGKYVREEKKLSLVDALRKMTLEPAKRLLMDHRKGVIKVGADADITIFDPETIIDGPTFTDISLPNKGIDCVLVNGRMALKDNLFVNDRLGRFIAYQDK